MTIRKRNDAAGHKRGEGHYSSSKVGLTQKTYVVKKASVEGGAGDRNNGLSAKLDRK